MGKSKSRKLQKSSSSSSKPHSKQKKAASRKPTQSKKHRLGATQQPPTIPFDSTHRILLVGEGDFSFSRSILEHHSCGSLYATSYDPHSTLLSKYPQAASNIKALEAEDCKVECGVDATKLGRAGGSGGGKHINKGGWDRLVFNFPHVGGLTRDVNRQVRANQELLVGFFKCALPLLSPRGQIIVTIFEGEPYELWNIRDLARHAGLRVDRSFKFQPDAYPGYKHARTLGNIEGGGGWRGEDRPARTYVLADNSTTQTLLSTKRKQDASDSEDD